VYERYAAFLGVDQMVIVEGRLSFREEEDPKIMVDSVRTLSRENAGVKLKSPKETQAEARMQREKAAQQRKEAALQTPPARTAAAPHLSDAQMAKQADKRVYLLIPDRSEIDTVKELCSYYPGDTPVYMKIADEGIALLLSREHWCSGEMNVLEEFRAQFGSCNVVVK